VGYNNSKTFANLKKKLIPYIINNLDNIEHPYRDLLNIILENTEFALTLKKHHKIYIVDEAISR
jgi:hypothetical protein